MSHSKTLIVIAGPTAIGKTSVAIDLATYYNTEIISADSRQCYKEMNIGVARPTVAELAAIKHHFIASHSIHGKVDVASFEKYALHILSEVFKKNDFAICVGGTGLYIKALLEGIDEIPPIDEAIRLHIQENVALNGIIWLQQQLQMYDAAFVEKYPALNNHRYQRALGVFLTHKTSILSYQRNETANRPFRVKGFQLSVPREVLYNNINNRVLQMIDNGLLQEVEALLPYKQLQPLQTIGYKEVFDYMDGQYNKEKMLQLIQQHTRNYAKRQITWFTHQTSFEQVLPHAKNILEKI